MKSKIIVAIALFISIFLAGSILIFGFVKSEFILIYFFFSLGALGVFIFSTKSFFSNKSDITFAVIAIVFMAGFFTYFADGANSYLDQNKQLIDNGQDIKGQIDNLTSIDSHYSSTIADLQYQISTAQTNMTILQSELDTLTTIKNSLPKIIKPEETYTPQEVINTEPVIAPVITPSVVDSPPTITPSHENEHDDEREDERDD
jgi:hypothetical protein